MLVSEMTPTDVNRIVMLSCWSNDGGRALDARAAHLLSKVRTNVRLAWLVGDSEDETFARLQWKIFASGFEGAVALVQRDTGIRVRSFEDRLARLSLTLTYMLELVEDADDVVIIHESDLLSPPDVVDRLLAMPLPSAGWPVLRLEGGEAFYDTWAFRKDGERFTNWPPYHACYRADGPFEIDSAGSVTAWAADDVRGVNVAADAIIGLCAHVGKRVTVDPSLRIVQPRELWQPW